MCLTCGEVWRVLWPPRGRLKRHPVWGETEKEKNRWNSRRWEREVYL